MKKKNILFWMFILLLAIACKRETILSDAPLNNTEGLLKVCIPADALSKAYFPDEETGGLLLHNEEYRLIGVPVEEDGAGGQTLRYDLAIICGESNGMGHSSGGWNSDGYHEEFEQHMRYYYYFDKTPHDFFTQFDKCVFFLIGSGDSDYGYWHYYLNGGECISGFRAYVDFVNLPASGDDHYYFKTAVSQAQIDTRVGTDVELYNRGFAKAQTICGHTDVLTERDIVERDDYAISFPVLRLSNALLQFKIQLQDGPSVEMRRLKITLKNDVDHSADPAWYHVLSGQTFTDFSGFADNRYAMYSVPNVNSLYAGAVNASEYDVFDHVILGWTDSDYSSNPAESYTLSTTLTDRYFYACVVPQSEYIDEHSYLLFEALDSNGEVVGAAKKYLPEGGFQAGKRYDFTLALSEALPDPADLILPGEFSVSSAKKVKFSCGNLMYDAGKWNFHTNQNDRCWTADAGDVTISASATFDFFGWATAGVKGGTGQYGDYGATETHIFYQPWSIDAEPAGYGPQNTDLLPNTSWLGSVYEPYCEWGQNPDLITRLGEGWRTLSHTEWDYLLTTRPASMVNGVANARFVKGRLQGVAGLFLFPDIFAYDGDSVFGSAINDGTADYEGVAIGSEMEELQALGLVFLPACGLRWGTDIDGTAHLGAYWCSAAAEDGSDALTLNFDYDASEEYDCTVRTGYRFERECGLSVRLVKDADPSLDASLGNAGSYKEDREW